MTLRLPLEYKTADESFKLSDWGKQRLILTGGNLQFAEENEGQAVLYSYTSGIKFEIEKLSMRPKFYNR